jgi:glutamate-ammonia-ligase adenylyltransferase
VSSNERTSVLTQLARDGFGELGDADALLTELMDALGMDRQEILRGAAEAATPTPPCPRCAHRTT